MLIRTRPPWTRVAVMLPALAAVTLLQAQPAALSYPPRLPDDQAFISTTSDRLLKPTTDTIQDGVAIARTAPTVEMLYFPGQDYPGDPWSNWGDALFANGKFYASIGDHLSPRGTALVYEYDPETRTLRILANLRRFFEIGDPTHDETDRLVKGQPVQRGPDSLLAADENYTPGKIHSRLDIGADGRLYYTTHRGSARTTTDDYGFRGDWLLATDPASGTTEIIAAYPLDRHCLPAGVLDAGRMIYYAGSAPGRDADIKGVRFLAYDVAGRRLLHQAENGFDRYAILDPENGRIFWNGQVYDPAANTSSEAPMVPHIRSATRATHDGWVYGTSGRDCDIWGFNVRSREIRALGNGAVGVQRYVTSMVIDPSGRYLYYIPGAHGGGPRDGTPVVQFDVRQQTRKIIAFLHPLMADAFGYTVEGTFGIALDDTGSRLFITANGKRDPRIRAWESCAAIILHIPESERQP